MCPCESKVLGNKAVLHVQKRQQCIRLHPYKQSTQEGVFVQGLQPAAVSQLQQKSPKLQCGGTAGSKKLGHLGAFPSPLQQHRDRGAGCSMTPGS